MLNFVLIFEPQNMFAMCWTMLKVTKVSVWKTTKTLCAPQTKYSSQNFMLAAIFKREYP